MTGSAEASPNVSKSRSNVELNFITVARGRGDSQSNVQSVARFFVAEWADKVLNQRTSLCGPSGFKPLKNSVESSINPLTPGVHQLRYPSFFTSLAGRNG